MTRDGVLAQINDALAGAGKTAPRALIQALKDAGQFIEDSATQPAARNDTTASSEEGVSTATAAPPGLLEQCATELEEAIALKVGVMDSDNRIRAVEGQRLGVMQTVAARLREYS